MPDDIRKQLEDWRLAGERGLDPLTQRLLKEDQTLVAKYDPYKKDVPVTSFAGIPAAQYYLAKSKQPGVAGFVFSPQELKGGAQAVFVSPRSDHSQGEILAHEAEHLLSRQNLPEGMHFNKKFDELIGAKTPEIRNKFVMDAINSADYLKKKYGFTPDAYFDPKMAQVQNYPGVLLQEQLASLSALEQMKKVDLTKDPVLRKTLFKDPAVRETYQAMTGLRQTRLDPRDIPPYTRVPEVEPQPTRYYGLEEPSMTRSAVDKAKELYEKAKKSIGFNDGGNTKLI